MDNKEENSNLVESRSGVTDQTESVPAVDAGEVESKLSDPTQAEPLPGDQGGQGDDDTTNGNQRRGGVVEQGGSLGWKNEIEELERRVDDKFQVLLNVFTKKMDENRIQISTLRDEVRGCIEEQKKKRLVQAALEGRNSGAAGLSDQILESGRDGQGELRSEVSVNKPSTVAPPLNLQDSVKKDVVANVGEVHSEPMEVEAECQASVVRQSEAAKKRESESVVQDEDGPMAQRHVDEYGVGTGAATDDDFVVGSGASASHAHTNVTTAVMLPCARVLPVGVTGNESQRSSWDPGGGGHVKAKNKRLELDVAGRVEFAGDEEEAQGRKLDSSGGHSGSMKQQQASSSDPCECIYSSVDGRSSDGSVSDLRSRVDVSSTQGSAAGNVGGATATATTAAAGAAAVTAAATASPQSAAAADDEVAAGAGVQQERWLQGLRWRKNQEWVLESDDSVWWVGYSPRRSRPASPRKWSATLCGGRTGTSGGEDD